MGRTIDAGRLLSGRYKIDEPVGSGGMATVWKGRDLRLDRPVAIKELAGPWLADPTAVARFDREARMAARLAHPNIVSVYDVGIHDATRYLIMELIEGTTVASMITKGPLTVAQAITIAIQTCDGLSAAHAAGVIHRDVKPANLIVTAAGGVKICDFGIATALLATADTRLTGPTYAMGSSSYMAPEQADGQVDERTDLYGLGCTMYAMLTGHAPFAGDVGEILYQHRNEVPVPLRKRRADVGEALETLVAQLLAKDPTARPANASDVRARLEAIQSDRSARPSLVVGLRSTAPAEQEHEGAGVTTDVEGVTRASRAGRRRMAFAAAFVAFAVGLVWLVAALVSGRHLASGSRAEWIPPLAAQTEVAVAPAEPEGASTPSIELIRSPAVQETLAPSSDASAGPIASVPADPVATLRLSILDQVNTGHLNPDKASDLYKKVDELARAINVGNTGDAAKKIKELRDRFTVLRNEGQLTATGYDAMMRNLDAVAALVP